jgi:hypothetical protein
MTAMNASIEPTQSQVPHAEVTISEETVERRDEGEREQNPGEQHTYRLFNYSNARRRPDREDSCNVWDQLLDLHLHATEGRDDCEETTVHGLYSPEEDDGGMYESSHLEASSYYYLLVGLFAHIFSLQTF